jgi:glycosyltransferase involved in cell wall biosynthesis
MQRIQPDIVLLGHLHFARLAPLFRKFINVPIICVLHGIEAWTYNKKLQKGVNTITSFWSVSQYTRRTFSGIYAIPTSKIDLIFNTLSPTWENKVIKPQRDSFLLSVCRLDKGEKYKGVDRMLHAVQKLKDIFLQKKFKYIVVAHGNDVRRHKNLVEELGINDVVEFQGRLSEEELQRLYENCYAFALPSAGEGFGIVYLEAMAYQKACIAHQGCGAEDVVLHNHTGFQIATDEELIQSISFLLSNPEASKKMGENGFALLQEKFVFSAFQDRMNQILAKCVV